MWKVVKNMVGGTTSEKTNRRAYESPKLSRQELSELFSDLLAGSEQGKHTLELNVQPRHLTARHRLEFT